MEMYYVYILECADGSYYVGVTNDMERRLSEHQSGSKETAYTARRLPVELVYVESHGYINNAIAREKNLKSWTRAKKKALIEMRFQALKLLAKKKFPKPGTDTEHDQAA